MHAPPPLPAAIAFRTASDGLLGTSRTIEATHDGGRTWRVVFRTPRPVLSLSYDPGGPARAILDDGENLAGPRWRPTHVLVTQLSPCPAYDNEALWSGDWVLCVGQGGAGSAGKAVYRLTRDGWRRVAYAPFPSGRGYGGLGIGGYAIGIAMAPDGFGIIWESRGTLFVTHDGGSHWQARTDVAQPEVDFGIAGAALPHGVAYVILARGNVHRRLLVTTDAGRTWRVLRRWG